MLEAGLFFVASVILSSSLLKNQVSLGPSRGFGRVIQRRSEITIGKIAGVTCDQ
jgi:hypothetical protein